MEVDYEKINVQSTKEFLEEAGESLEELGIDERYLLRLLQQGF